MGPRGRAPRPARGPPLAAEPFGLPYAVAREDLRDGDVLLFQGKGWASAVIRWATRSRYSHAGMALRVGPRVMLVESRELRGCRMVPLSAAVAAARVTWFRLAPWAPQPDRAALVAAALDRLGAPYGWRHVALDALGRLPALSLLGCLGALRRVPLVGRWVARLPWGAAYSEDDLADPGRRVKCSTYVALCWRAAGVDLVPRLADRSTDPGDLARSGLLDPAGVLEAPVP